MALSAKERRKTHFSCRPQTLSPNEASSAQWSIDVIVWRPNWRNTHRFAGASASRAIGGCLGMLMLLLHGPALAASVEWPAFGPERDYLHFKGFANAVPDFVGPIDGSAELTIFTEGNHFPVLLPLTLEAFPAWCRSTRACNVKAAKILIVTLPQPMIIDILLKGGVRLGNAVLPVGRSDRVFPSIVMGGRAPLAQLAAAGMVQKKARVFARHRGLGLLVRRDLSDITELNSFSGTSSGSSSPRSPRLARATNTLPRSRRLLAQMPPTISCRVRCARSAAAWASSIVTCPSRSSTA